MINPEDLAFPINGQYFSTTALGLTKREYFAALAMQGIMNNDPRELLRMADTNAGTIGEWIAKNAVTMADTLIVELSK